MIRNQVRLTLAAALALGLAAPVSAIARPVPAGPVESATTLAPAAPIVVARRGADDRPGDDHHRRGRGGKGRGGHDDGEPTPEPAGPRRAGRGPARTSDDPAGALSPPRPNGAGKAAPPP